MTSTSVIDVDHIRADFPILNQQIRKNKSLVYLDNAASTQHPNSVIEAQSRCYREFYSNVHRGSHTLSMKASEAYESARETVRRFMGAADVSEIVFTSGTTAAINLVAHSMGSIHVQTGDEIVLTLMEHHSNIVPWQQLAQRLGARVRFAALTGDGHIDLESFKQCLNERTKFVAVAAISNVLGTRNDIRSIANLTHEQNAYLLVDAAQHAPHDALDVQDWNADFVAISAHKMLGPSGIGALYGKRELLESMPPFLGGGSMISSVTTDGHTPGEIPSRFEAGTPPIAEAVGFEAAIEYLEEVGLESIAAHESELVQMAIEKVQQIEGVRIFGPAAGERAGIMSFAVDGCSTHDISTLIDREGVAIRDGHHCAMPLHRELGISSSCRASFYLYNNSEEVTRFAEALSKVVERLRG